jgi:hypothetical protein
VTPEVYWRRRFIALAAGLAVFGTLAWAVGGTPAAHQTAATTSFSKPSQHPATPIAYPSPTASSVSSPSPSLSPSPSGSKAPGQPAKKPKAAAARYGAAKRHGAHQHTAGGVNAPGDDCPARDIVVSLVASGDTFNAAARPVFTITVVSTAGRDCRFNIGPRYLTLVIESGGVREWGSGDCVRGGGTQVTMLARGVPVQRRISWNRTLSAPGCRLLATAAQPGYYTATASDAGVRSRTVVFVLR